MNKKILFLIVLFFTFFVVSPTHAQQANQKWSCLSAMQCWKENKGKCQPEVCWKQPAPDNRTLCASDNTHRAQLTVKDGTTIEPSAETYIVECIETQKDVAGSQICTTGKSETDMKVFGEDNVAKLELATENDRCEEEDPTDCVSRHFEFEGMWAAGSGTVLTNPVQSDSQGKLNPQVLWQSYTPIGLYRRFFALNYLPDVTAEPTAASGEAKTQQQGGLGFFSSEGPSDMSNCAKIAWDPFGRIFDSKSLEPIASARITLQKRVGNTTQFVRVNPYEFSPITISNPYIVKDDGIFSFVVPDGQYKLVVEVPDYDFPNNPAKLDKNYQKAYYEIYRGDVIVQKGKMEHRDIPIDPRKLPASNPVKMMGYSYDLNKYTNTLIIDGKVSHPLTKIKAYSLKVDKELGLVRNRLLKTIQADKWGKFTLEIDQSKFEPTEIFGEIELEKVNLTQDGESQQSNKVISLGYIPNYLEGYAYDNNNNIIANATVGVYLTFSNKPYFQTKADEKGYFKIAPSSLPFFPYEIRYTTPLGSAIKTTTSKFVSQNEEFITTKKINLNDYKKNTILAKTNDNQGFIQNQIGTNKNGNKNISEKSLSNNNQLMVPIIMLTLLLAGAAIILGFYIYKKNRSGNL